MDKREEQEVFKQHYGGADNVPFSLRPDSERTKKYARWLRDQVRRGAQPGLFDPPAAPNEHRAQLDAEAATLQFAQPLDRRQDELEDAPLFGGPRQGELI